MKKRSIFSLLKLRFKLYLRWVAHQYKKNEKPEVEYIPPEPKKPVEETEPKQNDGCASGGCAEAGGGCGCLIVFLIVFGKAVLWAWHIHWLFGILLLLFIISLFG